VDALVAAEITGKLPAVTDADVAKFVSDNREHVPNPSAVMPQIRAYLLNERSTARRGTYLSELRTQAKVQVLLKAPAPYRADVGALVGRAMAGSPRRSNGAPARERVHACRHARR